MCRGRGVDATQSPPAGPRRRFARAQVVPFIFGEAWGWFTPILALVVAWALLGIEAAAVECERPVRGCANHMPLEAFCAVVADNVRQTLQHSAGLNVSEAEYYAIVSGSAQGLLPSHPLRNRVFSAGPWIS